MELPTVDRSISNSVNSQLSENSLNQEKKKDTNLLSCSISLEGFHLHDIPDFMDQT